MPGDAVNCPCQGAQGPLMGPTNILGISCPADCCNCTACGLGSVQGAFQLGKSNEAARWLQLEWLMEMKWSMVPSALGVWASLKAPGLSCRGWHFVCKDVRCSQNPAHTSARGSTHHDACGSDPLAGEPRLHMGPGHCTRDRTHGYLRQHSQLLVQAVYRMLAMYQYRYAWSKRVLGWPLFWSQGTLMCAGIVVLRDVTVKRSVWHMQLTRPNLHN